MSKAQANSKHARKRAKQRVGVDLGPVRTQQIIDDIQSAKGNFVGRQSKSRTVWRVDIEGTTRWVIYCRRTKTLVTVLDYEPKINPGVMSRANESRQRNGYDLRGDSIERKCETKKRKRRKKKREDIPWL